MQLDRGLCELLGLGRDLAQYFCQASCAFLRGLGRDIPNLAHMRHDPALGDSFALGAFGFLRALERLFRGEETRGGVVGLFVVAIFAGLVRGESRTLPALLC